MCKGPAGFALNYIATKLYRINLTAANFVHIMEPQWNPMVEAQAVDRVHRIGQTREVFVRRYTIKNSIETVSNEP